MAQHDMNIANQGFPAFRADLNDALGALVSNSSGATAPTTTFAHQFWVDTSANPSVLKQRNADNDAWITIGNIDQTGDKFILSNPEYTGTLTGGTGVVNLGSGQFYKGTDGKIGFGTATPERPFELVTTGTSIPMRVKSNGSESVVDFVDANTTANFRVRCGSAGDSFVAWAGGTERMRIDSAGNVGIGTSSPGAQLETSTGQGGSTIGANHGASGAYPKVSGISFGAKSTFLSVSNNGGTHAFSGGAGIYANNTAQSNNPTDLVFWTTAGGTPTERMRIDSSGNLLVGTTAQNAKLTVAQPAADRAQAIIGNPAQAQGPAQLFTIVRHYPVVSLGTKLIIPFVSQGSLYVSTMCRIMGLSAIWSGISPQAFSVNFAVTHLSFLDNLSSWGTSGNFASIAINGMNIEITFTNAYTSGTSDGVYVTIEYMTPRPEWSINVANIAMN